MAPIEPLSSTSSKSFSIVEASIDDLSRALDQGWTTSVELVAKYLRRIAVYDRHGKLNSIPLLNRSVFEEAAASDHRRANGLPIRPLEGIPFTVKDSYKVKDMTVSSGSPAFQNLIASDDAFTVRKLREAGAVLIGKTNMPPMAAGGMQRGCYGRAESPYNREYLTAAFGSGSSNGSATSTAASFAAFGMAEETVSSGRSPASNNGLVAYTPSRGLISIRGNWPLYPTCDVVVPHTRTVTDLFALLDIIFVEDKQTTGDFWRDQPFIRLIQPSEIRPHSFKSLLNKSSLQGRRIGVPKMYIGRPEALDYHIKTRNSILDLWKKARDDLESLGATVIEIDFPLMAEYDTVSATFKTADTSLAARDDKGDDKSINDGITKEWNAIERRELVAYAWDDFLLQNGDPSCPSLSNVDPSRIFPRPPGALPDRYTKLGAPVSYDTIVSLVCNGRGDIKSLPGIENALKALENRRKSFEQWLQREDLDCIIFPANADIGRADADTNQESADAAWGNGVMYSNGNRVIRHLGIPTVTVPMGIMADTKMPVGLTFASGGYTDVKLLEYAYAYEKASSNRRAPGGTPELQSDLIHREAKTATKSGQAPHITIEGHLVHEKDHSLLRLSGTVRCDEGLDSFSVIVDGEAVAVSLHDNEWKAEREFQINATNNVAEIDQTMVIALALGKNGHSNAKLLMLD